MRYLCAAVHVEVISADSCSYKGSRMMETNIKLLLSCRSIRCSVLDFLDFGSTLVHLLGEVIYIEDHVIYRKYAIKL